MPTTSRTEETEIDREVSRAMGLGTKLIRALESAGATRAEMNALAESESLLSGTIDVLRDKCAFAPPHHLVDMDAPPHLRWRYTYDPRDQQARRLHGHIDLSRADRVSLAVTKMQRVGPAWAHVVRKELADETVLGAAALEHYLQNQELVPADWTGFRVFFWGTILRGREHEPLVQYMYQKNGWEYGVLSAVVGATDNVLSFSDRAAVYTPPDYGN